MATAARSGHPSGWKFEPLGKLGRWIGGGTPSKAEPAFWTGGTIPWVSAKDMKTARIDQTVDTITEEAVRKSAARKVPAQSVLCVMRSGILAHTFPVAVNSVEVTINQDLRALVVRGDVDPDYLAHFLRYSGRDILHSCSKHGTTVSSIEASRLDGYEVPLPNREIQSQIVARIDELFTEINDGEEQLRRARAELETYRKSLLKAAVTGELTAEWRATNPPNENGADLLTQILADRRTRWEADPKNKGKRYKEPAAPNAVERPDLPPSWTWATIGQLAIVDSGATPSGIEAKATDVGEVPWFKVSSMSLPGNEQVLRHSKWWLTREQALRSGLRIFPRGSLVFPKLGGALLTNKRRVLAVDGCLDLNNMAVTAIEPVARYVRDLFTQIDLAALSDGSVVPQLKRDAVEGITIGLPGKDELGALIERIEACLAVADDMTADILEHIGGAATIRQSILTAAFRGELVQ